MVLPEERDDVHLLNLNLYLFFLGFLHFRECYLQDTFVEGRFNFAGLHAGWQLE